MVAGWRLFWVRGSRRVGAWPLLAAAFLINGVQASPAFANSEEAVQSGRQVWAGADVSTNVWLVYSGVTYAPWSAMHEDGFRFRAAGGFGEYEYADRVPSLDPSSDLMRATTFHAQTYYAEFLVGYLKRFGELTAKGFVGVSTISHDISPDDSETVAVGDEIGVKGAIELWLNIGERGWGSLDLSWSSAHNTRAARARLGYRVWPKLSLGLEAGLNVDSQGECRMGGSGAEGCRRTDDQKVDPVDLLDYARVGTFVRYEWGMSEMSVSGGVLGDSFAADGGIEIEPYVTVNWLTQF